MKFTLNNSLTRSLFGRYPSVVAEVFILCVILVLNFMPDVFHSLVHFFLPGALPASLKPHGIFVLADSPWFRMNVFLIPFPPSLYLFTFFHEAELVHWAFHVCLLSLASVRLSGGRADQGCGYFSLGYSASLPSAWISEKNLTILLLRRHMYLRMREPNQRAIKWSVMT